MKANELTQDTAVHRERRQRLAEALGEGIAVIPTAPERTRNRDTHYPYRYDSYFYYLTGFREPEAVLVLAGGAAPRSIFFCRERNVEREIWDGHRHGPEGARERFGFDEAHAIAALDEKMPALLGDRPALWYPVGADADWDARVMRWLNAVRANARAGVAAPQELRDVRAPLDEMRLVKDAHELAWMRQAGRAGSGRMSSDSAGHSRCASRAAIESRRSASSTSSAATPVRVASCWARDLRDASGERERTNWLVASSTARVSPRVSASSPLQASWWTPRAGSGARSMR